MPVAVARRPAGGTGLIFYLHPVGIRIKAPSFPAYEVPDHLKTYVEKFKAQSPKCEIKGAFAPRYGKIQSARNACMGKGLAVRPETRKRYGLD